MKFVEWPSQAFAATNSPIVIGALGESDSLRDALSQAVQDKVINGHSLQFKELQSFNDAGHCQVVFIGAREKRHFSQIFKAVGDKSILTVGESDNFIESGGIINFVIRDNHVRFQIDDTHAKKIGLKISSNLLSIAVPIH